MIAGDPTPDANSPASPHGQPASTVAFFHAQIKGRVQGVGFRFWTVDTAESLGVNGWVRNCWDGSVEVEAEGPRQVLEEFLQKLREGPSLAHVRDVEIEWGERAPRHRCFTVTH